jgi:hypothetical protein
VQAISGPVAPALGLNPDAFWATVRTVHDPLNSRNADESELLQAARRAGATRTSVRAEAPEERPKRQRQQTSIADRDDTRPRARAGNDEDVVSAAIADVYACGTWPMLTADELRGHLFAAVTNGAREVIRTAKRRCELTTRHLAGSSPSRGTRVLAPRPFAEDANGAGHSSLTDRNPLIVPEDTPARERELADALRKAADALSDQHAEIGDVFTLLLAGYRRADVGRKLPHLSRAKIGRMLKDARELLPEWAADVLNERRRKVDKSSLPAVRDPKPDAAVCWILDGNGNRIASITTDKDGNRVRTPVVA